MINKRFVSNGVIYTIAGASSLEEFFDGLEIKEQINGYPSTNYVYTYKCVINGEPGLFKYAEFYGWRILEVEVSGRIIQILEAESCIRESFEKRFAQRRDTNDLEKVEEPLLYLDNLIDKAKSK